MGRPRSDNPKTKQLLIRVTDADLRILEAAAAIRRKPVVSYARDVLVRDVDVLSRDPLIQRQLDIFEEFEGRTEGRLASLEPGVARLTKRAPRSARGRTTSH